jgi:hypothetical protein
MVCKTIIGGSIPPRASKILLSNCLMPMETMAPISATRDKLALPPVQARE